MSNYAEVSSWVRADVRAMRDNQPAPGCDADLRAKMEATRGQGINPLKLAVDTVNARYGFVDAVHGDYAAMRDMDGGMWAAKVSDCISLGWNYRMAKVIAAAWMPIETGE